MAMELMRCHGLSGIIGYNQFDSWMSGLQIGLGVSDRTYLRNAGSR